MNRYPLWKNILIGLILFFGLIYTLPNFYGEVPAVQVSSGKTTVQLEPSLAGPIEEALRAQNIQHTGMFMDANSIRFRFDSTESQLLARDLIENRLNPDPSDPSYVVALNLLPASPNWLTAIRALPMYLGLDLRGGVHFLLQVDMPGAITKHMDAALGDMRTTMRERGVRHAGISREGSAVHIRFRDAEQRDAARRAISSTGSGELQLNDRDDGPDNLLLIATLTQQARQTIEGMAIKQNINTLHNRINELGVAEPVIQQQGADRIVVQLPGVQDVAKAKDLIGRTATLQVRMAIGDADPLQPPLGAEVFPESRDGRASAVVVDRQVLLTGDHFVSASSTFDSNQRPAVSVRLDAAGGRTMRDITRENLYKPMAIILFEKNRGEAISVATIQGEFSNQFQITGNFSTDETTRLAMLIRSGSLAAPMEIIEERTVGPSLGAENIARGFNSVMWGMVAIAIFIVAYYSVVGLVSVTALAANLILLIALLSLLQATLTLPGMAAIALTLGMAIDANVLINERIREELRNGVSPQAAINAGYDRAFDTILDANITTFIAGVALLVFGSGPVRGFAVVLCLGIITSVFSAVLVSRMLVNLVYGHQRKLTRVRIG
ncbi:MAG: protein translocase subunit SecD [Rhodocyclaceae bacterium]